MPKKMPSSDIIKKSQTKRSKVVQFKKKRNYKKMFLFVLLLVLVIYTALFTPLFNVNKIEVYGNEKFSQDDIANMTGITLGTNIFRVNYFKVKDNILNNQYINKVKIYRSYPSKIKIVIEERKPAGYFDFMGSFLVIDKTGIVLDVLSSVNELQIPDIIGIKFKDYKISNAININKEDKAKFNIVLQCIDAAMNNGLLTVINKIDVTDVSKIVIYAYRDKYQINLMDEQKIPYKFKFASKILADREKDKSHGGIIDFTSPGEPTFKPR